VRSSSPSSSSVGTSRPPDDRQSSGLFNNNPNSTATEAELNERRQSRSHQIEEAEDKRRLREAERLQRAIEQQRDAERILRVSERLQRTAEHHGEQGNAARQDVEQRAVAQEREARRIQRETERLQRMVDRQADELRDVAQEREARRIQRETERLQPVVDRRQQQQQQQRDQEEPVNSQDRASRSQDFECHICFEAMDKVFTFVPCGHAGYCKECAMKLKNCPMCREEVQGLFQIHL